MVVLVCGDDEVDLPLALDRLAALGHEHVLCEGGPTLFRDALAAGVVDELDLSIAPALVGGGHRLLRGPARGVVRLELRQLLEEDGLLFARYAVVRPRGPVTDALGPAQRVQRLLDGEQHGRLDRAEGAAAADGQCHRRHRDVVRRLPEVDPVVGAEGVPEPVQRSRRPTRCTPVAALRRSSGWAISIAQVSGV